MQNDIVIHVWSDIACPWCAIASRRLQKGIELSGQPVAVEYHAYQLNPDAPTAPAGSEIDVLMHAKRMEREAVEAMLASIAQQANAEGLEMNFDDVQPVNTFLAHQLVYAAKSAAPTPLEAAIAGATMVERLQRAYFTEGLNIADPATLVKIGTEMGLVGDDVLDVIEAGEFADDVRSDIRDAASLGIHGVPFFIVAGKFGISGAQSPETFAETINRAAEELREEAENEGKTQIVHEQI